MGPQPTAELVRNPVIDVINICCVIANFIRVAPKVINLQKLIREACP